MKRTVKSVISFILAGVMLFSMGTTAFATDGQAADNTGIIIATNLVNSVLNGVFSLVSSLFPTSSIPTAEEYFAGESENFYEGTADFLDVPAEDAKWSLGFAKASLTPENLADGTKKYYTGGYFTQQVDSVYDDQQVHAIALNDGSDRGTAVTAQTSTMPWSCNSI